MTQRQAPTSIRIRLARLIVTASLLIFSLGVVQLVHAADGSDVVGQLGKASNVVGLLAGSIGDGGAFSAEENADSIPFLGDAPASLADDLFAELDDLSGFNGITANADDLIEVVVGKIDAISGPAGSGWLPVRTFMCGNVECVPSTDVVSALTSIRLGLSLSGSETTDFAFDDIGLPSLGFIPEGQILQAELAWTITATLVADTEGLTLGSGDGPELDLEATITAPTGDYVVNLGAMKVRATSTTQPAFTGHLLIDVTEDGSFDFSFGPDTGFAAAWHLATEDSPLMGIEGDLVIDWPLAGPGVDPGELTITVEDIVMDTSQFIGEDLQAAAASLRDITRPLRTATSPMMEPIPGMSDFSAILPGGGDVTMLRLMELAESVSGEDKAELRIAIERLLLIDDVVSALEGGGADVPLGSFTLVGDKALTPVGLTLDAGDFRDELADLNDILDEASDLCEPCRESVNELLTAVNGAATPGEGGFSFDLPVLTDPASLAGLLLGRDVDLITFDTDKVGYEDTLKETLARFFIFSVELRGKVEASLHLKGGVDTRGITDALLGPGGSAADIVNGLYLEDPGDDAVVRLFSDTGIHFAAGIGVVDVSIGGGPKPNVALQVPPGTPDDKLRPALLEDADGIGCALVEGDDGFAEFSVFISAKFDYWIDDYERVLAEHTFLTEQDLCSPESDDIEVAVTDGNGELRIRTATERGIPDDEPDLVKVFMRHDPDTGEPSSIVVTVNGNKYGEFDPEGISVVRYDANGSGRAVIFRVVANDDKPFEKKVDITTGDGADDVSIDSTAFAEISVNGGPDTVIVTAGSSVNGGPGDDRITGSAFKDVLDGDAGDDVINGGDGEDILIGDLGNDVLIDTSEDGNCLQGGPDNDLIVGGPGADFLNGDTGVCSAAGFALLEPTEVGDDPGEDTIVTGGGADHVVAGNGNDDIRLHSSAVAAPNDPIWAAGVKVYGNGGNDIIFTGKGRDIIHGGPGDDEIVADGGRDDSLAFRNGDIDTVWGGLGDDTIETGDLGDIIYGDNGVDTCVLPIVGQPLEADTAGGDDTVHGGDGADRIALEGGDDEAYGDGGDDLICGHAGIDTIFGDGGPGALLGGGGADTVFGGTGADIVDGEGGDDLLFGNAGSDEIDGGTGGDRIVGGSSAPGVADAGDVIDGGDEADIIIGDNGVISAGTPAVVNVYDLFATDPSLGGSDTINGGQGEDRIFGGLHGDTIHGDGDDDHLEGNVGDDAVYGDDGEDDIIGGTSPEALPNPVAGQAAADAPDVGETILSGGAGRDVIIGDNGIITRPGGTDPIIGGVARAVTLLDRDRTGAALAAVSGGDYIEGNGDSDRIYGQGGADYLKGNEADDFVEGNQDGDRLEGNDGEDDLIGGSSFASAPGVGDPDGADQIAGGAGADVLLGDNALISRATTGTGTGFDWDSVANSWLGQTARRSITLLDKATLQTANFDGDTLSGGAGVDVLFGQDGDDRLYGGSHDDYMEGNGGSDLLFGDHVAPPTGDPRESEPTLLDGTPGPDGQDDQIGGSSWVRSTSGNGAVTGQRDGADVLYGDGNADVQLGDNGRILRRIVGNLLDAQYLTHEPATGKPTIVRQAAFASAPATALPTRFDVGAPASAGVWGNDVLHGDDGDDLQFGQDGDDTLYGGAGDDDMYGELGADRMFGQGGEDAMLGDRGVIRNLLVTTPGATFSVTGPPQISFTPFAAHQLDRRFDLADDGDGAPQQAPGMTTGGNDFMRGGADHDSMHGGAGNDLMNGDSGGDYLFGDDGVDVMWGGKGRDCVDLTDLTCVNDRGANDMYVDYLFGGAGLKTDPVTGGADILDYRPRPDIDPAAWFEITGTRISDPMSAHQHHQGIDWIYGGKDRDVMQADVADNGPNQGDRLIDWTGAYNLYSHCNAAYGGFNDVRQISPSMQSFLERLAFALGAGKTLADVQTKGTSGYNELALVYKADIKSNSGSAYPSTPGHFEESICTP